MCVQESIRNKQELQVKFTKRALDFLDIKEEIFGKSVEKARSLDPEFIGKMQKVEERMSAEAEKPKSYSRSRNEVKAIWLEKIRLEG